MEKKVRRIFVVVLALVVLVSTFAEHQMVVSAAGTPELKHLPALTGNPRTDVVHIAKNQVGYKEGGVNLNAYGRAMGNNGQAWCVYFVLWCLDQAGVKERPVSGNTCNNVTWFQKRGLWHNQQSVGWKSGANQCDGVVDADYIPQVGDVVSIENDGSPSEGPDHTGIVVAVDDSWVYTVEGNISNSVAERKYSRDNGKLNGKSSSVYVNGYGSINYDETIPLGEMTEKKFTTATTATDGKGTKTDSSTTVESKLSITTQPTDVSVSEDTEAVFKVTAKGSALSYQWQFKNTSMDYWSDSAMAGATTNSITVKATTARNGYQYRCVVKDGNENKLISNSANLKVTEKAQIESQPETQIVMEDSSTTFKVAASGNDLTYQWQYRNVTDNYWYDSTMPGSDTESISVKAISTRNGYQYRCLVVDSSGNKVISNTAILVVIQKIKITGQPVGQTVAAGNKATFKVTANGSGLTYKWQYKSATDDCWYDSIMPGADTASVTVKATTARNGYQYRCVVKDSNGKKLTSNAAKLTVK